MPEIQAIRALAVTIVVLYHLWPHGLTGGFVGVDVFGLESTEYCLLELAAVAAHGRAVLDQRNARVRVADRHIIW